MNNDLKPINTIPNFKRFCMTIGELPTSYLETMTYYEMLVWFTEYMKNTIIPTINNNGLAVQELQDKYIELKSYVDNYFNNLDVQQEINNKLDQMVTDGTLQEIIASYLNSKALFGFDNVEAMKNATNLINGSYTYTLGFHTKNDNGNATYKIRNITNEDVVDEMLIISLNNSDTLIAELIYDNPIIPEKLGAYGDGIHDDSDAIQTAFNTSKKVLLVGYYLCTKTINIPNASQLTINGVNFNESALKFTNESYLNIGGNSNVNELRLNNFSIIGDRTQSALLKINYVTNVMLNQINIAESNEYLVELNHADIVFIDKCTFAGSNVLDIWQPCKGIKMTSANPVYISNCNIWNMTQFIDVIGLTRTIELTHNWIEFVNILINSKNTSQNHMNLIVNDNNITYPSHGNISFIDAHIIYLENINDAFDILLCVKNNNIICYTENPIASLIELKTVTDECNVYIENNIMFTRLSQMNAYALKVDLQRKTKLYYTSTTNADADNGCETDGVLNKSFSPRELNLKNVNLSTTDSELGLVANFKNGHIWYNNNLYIKHQDVTKSIPITSGETITNIPDTSTATTEDVGAKLNALMNILRRTNIIR